MRAPICVLIASALLVLATPAYDASRKDADDCQADSPDRTIAVCTQVIGDSDEIQRVRAIAYYRRGIAWSIKGDYNRANADFAEAMRLDAKLPDHFHSRGAAWQIKGDLDRAIAEYTAAIRLDPKHARAYAQRGRAWYAKGDHERAVADWSEGIRLDPKHAAAYEGRASVWHAKDDFDRAIADYTEAIRINPNLFRAFMERGRAWFAKGEHDHAIADYTAAIRLDSKHALLYFNRGLAWSAKSDNERAIADLTAAIRFDSKHVESYRKRGQAYFYKGDFAAAAADLLQVSDLTSDAYSMLWRFLARGRMDQDGTAELDANAVRLKSRGWPYPVIDLYLGRRSLEEMLSAARLEAMRAPAPQPDETCQAEYYAGQWHLLRGNKNGAKARLQVAADTCPKDHIEYSGAVAELKRLEP